jgi:hypothetical protein
MAHSFLTPDIVLANAINATVVFVYARTIQRSGHWAWLGLPAFVVFMLRKDPELDGRMPYQRLIAFGMLVVTAAIVFSIPDMSW